MVVHNMSPDLSPSHVDMSPSHLSMYAYDDVEEDHVVWRERLEAAVKTLITYHADINAANTKVGLQAYHP